ncbi:cytokine receptor common subunit beta-like isoform X2 [Brachyhypopomus gauderio]|uniref:cytokine receptor common subunit beta-like isoform X2 n=1 Tax=Brachyhypopomus gauderio TaxID=698409 RepID=UPI0040426590
MRTHIRYPGTALLLWASCSSLPPSAVPPPGAPACPDHGKSAPASPVLESLECSNDYLTHIRCSWTEVPGASVSLFHLDRDDSRVLPCVAVTPLSQNASGQPQARCRYNTSLFAIGFDDVFFFHTPHSSGTWGIVNLTQHEDEHDWLTRRHTPHDLAANISSNESWTQDWLKLRPFLPSHQTPDACFTGQPNLEWLKRAVMMRKRHRRETAVEERGSELEVQAEEHRGEERGERSEEVPASEDQHTGAHVPWIGLPGPFNLQCVYNGESEVRCSWQMMRQQSQFILYRLSYLTKPHAPSKWCCAVLDEEDEDNDVIRFSCSFPVPATELLLVHLSPEPRTKIIQSHKHIEPASPVGLHVALMGDDWVLNWTLPKHRTVPISSELRLWSTHMTEDVKILLLPTGVSVYVLSERSLKGGVHYLAQVRSTVSIRRGPGAHYAGHPSPWTQPVHWTTRPGPDSSRVYLLLAASVSAALILIYFTLLAFHRRVRVWEVSLPSPFQSKVLEAVCQSHSEHLPSHTEVDDPLMSEACVLGRLELMTDWECSDVTMPPGDHSNGPYQHASQEGCCMTKLHSQAAEMWHFSVSNHSSQGGSSIHEGFVGVEVFLGNGRFFCLASNSHNALQPCSDGYQPSPLASESITQDTFLNVGLEDVNMYDV